jgi:hypothetical protein
VARSRLVKPPVTKKRGALKAQSSKICPNARDGFESAGDIPRRNLRYSGAPEKDFIGLRDILNRHGSWPMLLRRYIGPLR